MIFIKTPEPDIHTYLTKYFTKWFDVIPEQKSDCLACRIDILMVHKLYKNIQVGIEVKGSDDKK